MTPETTQLHETPLPPPGEGEGQREAAVAAVSEAAPEAAVAAPEGDDESSSEPSGERTRRKRRWGMQYLPDEVNRVLRDYDGGLNAKEISERHGVSKATLYRWISQFENQRTVDDDPGSMRMRIAVLESTVLHLSTAYAELKATHSQEEAPRAAS